MKRSGFKTKPFAAPVLAERPPRLIVPLTRPVNYGLPNQGNSTPKQEYVRSKALCEAYRLIPCQHCGVDDGTVCCAHSNLAEHSKGRSIKASDDRGASLCHACHSDLDQGRDMTRDERAAMWWAAHIRSVALLVAEGYWPKGIAVPDMPAVSNFNPTPVSA